MNDVIFIVGPTATGKTDVAFTLAKRLGAEIISCDSMLVYREISILTSKPPLAMREEIPHHCIDVVSVCEDYNVFRYFQDVTAVIEKLHAQDRAVIVCGGSGLYMSVLLDGIFEGAPQDASIRKSLTRKANENLKSLYDELQEIDPQSAGAISSRDAKRIVRALEVYYATGTTLSDKKKERKGLWGRIPIALFALTMERSALYEKINARVEQMFEEGVVDEVKKILALPLSLTAKKIIGVSEIEQYCNGAITLSQAKERIAKTTRNFAKRQFTWFRKDKRITWIDVERLSAEEVAERILVTQGAANV